MIRGIALQLLVLGVMRLPYVWSDQGLRETIRASFHPGVQAAHEDFVEMLEDAGHRVLHPHPLLGLGVRRFRRSTRLLKWTPVAVVFAFYWWLDASPWIAGLVLSSYIVGTSLMSDYTLTNIGARPLEGQRPPQEWLTLLPAVGLQLLACATGYALAFGSISAWSARSDPRVIPAMAAAVVLLSIAHLPVRVALRLVRRRRPPVFADQSSPDSYLYLRPFTDDQVRITWPQSIGFLGGPILQLVRPRFEELVSVTLMYGGPLVAIGRPGEPLPELGAARTYWPDDEWQQAIAQTAHRVAGVLLVAGLTKGVSWEIEHLRRWDMLRKTLILIPPADSPATLARMQHLLEDLGIQTFDFARFPPASLLAIGFDDEDRAVFFTTTSKTWAAYFGAVILHGRLVRGEIDVDVSD